MCRCRLRRVSAVAPRRAKKHGLTRRRPASERSLPIESEWRHKAEIAKAQRWHEGRTSEFRCLLSDTAITPEYITEKDAAGNIGQTLMAIVAEGKRGRIYLAPAMTRAARIGNLLRSWQRHFDLQHLEVACHGHLQHSLGLHTDSRLCGSVSRRRQVVASQHSHDISSMRVENLVQPKQSADRWRSDRLPLRDASRCVAYAEAVSVYLAFAINEYD